MDEIVVSSDWLAERLDESRVVDVREPWEFDGIGHIPGAANVPFDEYRSEFQGEAGHLPGADVFSELLSAVGIQRNDDLVAYDDTHGVFAARFIVTAELYGHPPDRIHLLDGDYSAWSRDHQVSTDSETWLESEYETTFQQEGPLVTIDNVRQATGDPRTILVDTREQWEFEEGHIPGAVRLDWRELVDDETRRLKPPGELEELLEARGIKPDRRVLLYCNTARRISHTYVVLRYLGYEDLAFYEGSLTEWEREGGEIETT